MSDAMASRRNLGHVALLKAEGAAAYSSGKLSGHDRVESDEREGAGLQRQHTKSIIKIDLLMEFMIYLP